jgi:hypothetical protein
VISIDEHEFFNSKLQTIYMTTDRWQKSSHKRRKVIVKLHVELNLTLDFVEYSVLLSETEINYGHPVVNQIPT